jgi:hypothetical protein
MTSDKYQVLRSASDEQLYLVCWENSDPKHLPKAVFDRGPWLHASAGPVEKLKSGYRLRLARNGFVLAWTQVAQFEPEE